jgi:hypothetical protein
MVFSSLDIATIIFFRGHHPNLEDQVSAVMAASDLVSVPLSIALYNSQG